MDERTVHIDEFFRRQMDGHTEMPPPAVWDALEKRLDEKPGRKRPFPIWWFWTIAGIILISSAVIIAGYLNTPAMPETHQVTNATFSQNTSTHSIIARQSNNNYENTIEEHIPGSTEDVTGTGSTRNTIQRRTEAGSAHKQTTNANNHPRDKHTVTHATQGNAEAMSAATDDNLPAVPRAGDRLRLLSVTPFGFELPVAVPFMPAPDRANLPGTTKTGNSLPSFADGTTVIEQTSTQVPVPELASASGMQGLGKSLPGISDNENLSTDTDIIVPGATPQDTSKKKRQEGDTSKSILEETVYAVDNSKKKPLPFAAGIKLGFTRGFDPVWNADKWVIAPYVEYGLPSNFSVMFQPAFLIGKARVGTFANSDQVFYEIRNTTFDSIAYVSRGKIDSSVITPNPPDTVFRTYRYGQVYDSIHVGYKVTNTQQWDVELPVMVKYRLNKTFAFIVGASATYSSALRTKEELTRYQGLARQYEDVHAPQTFYVTTQGQEPPPGPPRKDAGALFPYNTAPFSNYQPRQISETNNFWRYGFMLGASATIKERLMVELMLHKSGVNANSVPDQQLQRIYTQPYLRVMVGYKLTK